MTKKQKLLLFFTIVFLTVLVLGYTTYRRLPTYSFVIIQRAVEKHDWDTFRKHVDTEQVISTSYDTIIANSLNNDYIVNDEIRGYAMGFGNWEKPKIIAALNKEVEEYVKTGKLEDPVKSHPGSVQFQNERAVRMMNEKTGLGKLQLIAVDNTRLVGDYAIITLKVEDFSIEKVYLLPLKMKQLKDGTWQVVNIFNLQEYLEQLEKDFQEKLVVLNKAVTEAIQKEISAGRTKAYVHKSPAGYLVLNLALPVLFHNKKELSRISGFCRLQGPYGRNITVPFDIQPAAGGKGEQTLTYQKELLSVIPQEAAWADIPMEQVSITTTITQLLYQDGSSLTVKRHLQAVKAEEE